MPNWLNKLNTLFGVINKSTANKLKPRNRTYHFRDKKLKGFYIIVHTSGSKRYVVRKRPLGVKEAKPIIIGDTEVFTAKEAKEKLQQAHDDKEAQKNKLLRNL